MGFARRSLIHPPERETQEVELVIRNLADSCLLLVDRQLQFSHDRAQLMQGFFRPALPAQDHEIVPLAVPHRSSTQWCQPSPKGSSGRPAHRHFRGLLGVHSRYGPHTRAVTVNRDPLPEGFQSLRYLHDCSGLLPAGAFAGWGLHPLEKRRLITAHTRYCLSCPWEADVRGLR